MNNPKIIQNSKIFFICIVLSFTLTLISTIGVNISHFAMIDFGLFAVLPLTYFVGLCSFSLLYIIFILKSESKNLLILSTILLIIILFGTATFVEGTPRNPYSLFGVGIIDYVSNTGYSSTAWADTLRLSMYQNWPAVFYLGAVVHVITGLDIFTISMVTPVVSRLFYFIPLYLLFSQLLQDYRKSIFCCAFFFLMDWVNQDFFSTQNMGYLLLILSMAIFLKIIYNKKTKHEDTILLMICIFGVIISHGLSSISTVSYMFMFAIIFILFQKFFHPMSEDHTSKVLLLILLSIIFLMIWAVYGTSANMFSRGISGTISFDLSHIFEKFKSTESMGTSGSESRSFLAHLKIYEALAFLAIGIFGFLVYLYSIRGDIRKLGIPEIFCFSIIFVNIGVYLLGFYSDEALIRGFLFTLIPISYFATKLLENKYFTMILIIFFVISAPLHILLHYGNESFYYYSPNTYYGANFFFEYGDPSAKFEDVGGILGSNLNYASKNGFINSPTNDFSYILYYNNVITRKWEIGGTRIVEDYINNKTQNSNLVYENKEFKIILDNNLI
jgi:hypothetical protein